MSTRAAKAAHPFIACNTRGILSERFISNRASANEPMQSEEREGGASPYTKLNCLAKQARLPDKQRLIDVTSKLDAWRNPLEMKIKSNGNENQIQWISLLKALVMHFHRTLLYNEEQFCCSCLQV